jgi:hypothetical protein
MVGISKYLILLGTTQYFSILPNTTNIPKKSHILDHKSMREKVLKKRI